MLEKPCLADQLIIDGLKIAYGIEVATLKFLPLGAEMNSWVYRAEAQDQAAYFLKLKYKFNYEISIEIAELLYDADIKQIISPIKTIQGLSSQHFGDFTLIVYPFVEGQNGFNHKLTDEQWLTFGKALRKIHEIKIPPSMQHHVRHETYSPKWREIVRSLDTSIASKPSSDEIAIKLYAFMKQHYSAIQRLVNRAEQLAQKIQNESSTFVLCHSDIHGGNVLINASNSFYIVDWDEPIMAPKERDLMFIGGGVGNVWNEPNQAAHFYEGYGKAEVNLTILAYYRHERIVEDIALYAQKLLLATTGGEDRTEMYQHFISMFEPNGVVDIAFQTEKNVNYK